MDIRFCELEDFLTSPGIKRKKEKGSFSFEIWQSCGVECPEQHTKMGGDVRG